MMPKAALAKLRRRPETAFPVLPKDALRRLLTALDRPFIDLDARARLQRLLERRGEQHVVMLVRTIIESEGNESALVEPVVSAVAMVISDFPKWTDKGLAWIQAFDALDLNGLVATMRGLDLFKETSLPQYLSWVICNKLRKVFEAPAAPPAPRRGPKTGRKHNRNTPRYTKPKQTQGAVGNGKLAGGGAR